MGVADAHTHINIQKPLCWIAGTNTLGGWANPDVEAVLERFVHIRLEKIPASRRMKDLTTCRCCLSSTAMGVLGNGPAPRPAPRPPQPDAPACSSTSGPPAPTRPTTEEDVATSSPLPKRARIRHAAPTHTLKHARARAATQTHALHIPEAQLYSAVVLNYARPYKSATITCSALVTYIYIHTLLRVYPGVCA